MEFTTFPILQGYWEGMRSCVCLSAHDAKAVNTTVFYFVAVVATNESPWLPPSW